MHTLQQVARTCPHSYIWTCTHGYVHHTRIYTHIKKNMASVSSLCLRLLITYILYVFRLKRFIIPYSMKPARMSNTLSFLLHCLMLPPPKKMIRRRCAWLNRIYFVFTSLNARHRFLCTGSPGGGIVTWFLWRAFGKHLHLTFWNAYLRVTMDGTEQRKGEIGSLLEDVCHLTAGRCCFSPMFTLNTQV